MLTIHNTSRSYEKVHPLSYLFMDNKNVSVKIPYHRSLFILRRLSTISTKINLCGFVTWAMGSI